MTGRTGDVSRTELSYRECDFNDAVEVMTDEDIHWRLDYFDFSKTPNHAVKNSTFYGIYLNDEIIALLIRYITDHFYVKKQYRKYSVQCLSMFEERHNLAFFKCEKFRDAKLFALRNGYRLINDRYIKCHS